MITRRYSKLENMDLVSVAEQSRIDVWPVASKVIPSFIQAERYRVIVPDKEVEIFRANGSDLFLVEAESEFVSDFSESLWDAIGKIHPQRYGWYLQQFIKIEALRRLGQKNIRGVIWDADTVPLKAIDFFSPTAVNFFHGNEYHLPYFQTIDRLLKLDRVVPHSFIAQSFPCEPHWVSAFCEEIESSHQKPWWKAIIDCIDFEQKSGFSEYETLGNFVAHRFPGEWRWSDIPWERKGYTRFGSPANMAIKPGDANNQIAFAAFEIRDRERNINSPKTSALRQAMRSARALIRSLRPVNKPRDQLGELLSSVFASESPLAVVQVGANDGIQNGFLRPYLAEPGNYRAVLAEPIPQYFRMLQELYPNRPDIELRNVACGAERGSINLFDIPDQVAVQMNGSGPPNDWAKGRGSSSRATVVYWIWKNVFRGDAYVAKIPEWIASIRATEVPVVETQELLTGAEGEVLLVVDVQGMEWEVIRGLSHDNLPKWVVIEEDTGDRRARDELTTLGYSCLTKGPNLAFRRELATA